jgi:ketosteroid isomerase-like protein
MADQSFDDFMAQRRRVAAAFVNAARQFQHGGTTELEVLHSSADGYLGYWTGWQRAVVRVEGHAEAMSMSLRVTEVFRREHGSWKLIHPHADSLSEAKSKS